MESTKSLNYLLDRIIDNLNLWESINKEPISQSNTLKKKALKAKLENLFQRLKAKLLGNIIKVTLEVTKGSSKFQAEGLLTNLSEQEIRAFYKYYEKYSQSKISIINLEVMPTFIIKPIKHS